MVETNINRGLIVFIRFKKLLISLLILIIVCHFTNGESTSAEESQRTGFFGDADGPHFYVGHPTGVAVHPSSLTQKEPSDGDKGDKVTDILHALLNKYDSRIRPFQPDNPVVITVAALAFQVVDVVEAKSEIASTILLQQSWIDPRLTYDEVDGHQSNGILYITVNHDHIREIWLPDTYFANEKKAQIHEVTMTNDAVYLYRNGTVVRSTRITLNSDCPFQYEDFPFDAQQCEIIIGSHAFQNTDVRYAWDETFLISLTHLNSSTGWFDVTSHTGKFLVTSLTPNESSQYNHQSKTRLSLQITLQRSWRPFITRFYLPMVLFVFVSLGTLFIQDAKLGLIINLLNLAFVNIFTAIRSTSSDIPRTSTKTAFDTYFVICMTYIGLVILITLRKLTKLNNTSSSMDQSQREINGSRSRDVDQQQQQTPSRRNNRVLLHFDITPPIDVVDNHDDDDSMDNSLEDNDNHHTRERRNSDLQQIYRSPTYPVTFASKSRIAVRKVYKFVCWLNKYLRWVLVAAFFFTDYIYFKIHSVKY